MRLIKASKATSPNVSFVSQQTGRTITVVPYTLQERHEELMKRMKRMTRMKAVE
jgi:hypothetical protein